MSSTSRIATPSIAAEDFSAWNIDPAHSAAEFKVRQMMITQSAPGNIERAQRLTSASAAGWQQRNWQREQEKEWEDHLRNLQQCIGELLIKNQQLQRAVNGNDKWPLAEAQQ
jgi:hypothetical protein